jgi:hypothetical protein
MASCYLFSKANYPITIQYDGKDMVLPPNAMNFRLADDKKLGELPKMVRKVMVKEGK